MDAFVEGVLLVIIAAVMTWSIHESKKFGWDQTIRRTLTEYDAVFDVLGSVVKSIDEDLYDDMKDVLEALHDAVEKDPVCKKDVEVLLDEADDVFEDVADLCKKYRDAQ